MAGGAFQFRDQSLDAVPEDSVTGGRHNGEDETRRGGDEGLGNTAGQKHVTGERAASVTDCSEGADDPHDRPEKAHHGGKHSNIRKVGNPVQHGGGLSAALGEGNFLQAFKGDSRVLGRKIQRSLDDPRQRFAVPVRDCEDTKVVLFANEHLYGGKVLSGGDRSASDGEGKAHDQHSRQH